MVFIEGCLKNLENNKSVVVSLKLIPKLIQSFHNFPGWNIHSFISSLFFHSFIHSFILSFIHQSIHLFILSSFFHVFFYFYFFYILQFANINWSWVFSFNYLNSDAHLFSLLNFFILFNHLFKYSFNNWFDLICLFVCSINH